MKTDAIVDAVRSAREAYAASFDYDLAAMIKDARETTEAAKQAGEAVVCFPPRPPRPVPVKTLLA